MWWQSALGHNSQWSRVKSPKEHFFSWLWNQIFTPPHLISHHFHCRTSLQFTLLLYLHPLSHAILCLCCHHHLPLHSSLKPSDLDPDSPFVSIPLTLFHLQLLRERQRRKGRPISWDLLSPHWEAASKWQQKCQAEPCDCPLGVPWALQ